MAKANSNDILGLGKPLGSGPGAIRQFWNTIKPAMAPAAAWLKPAPTRSGQAWCPIKPHRNPIKPDRVPAETMLKPRSSWARGRLKEGQGWGIEGGAMHPSVLEAQSKSEAVAQLTVALRESNVPHLRWSQAPPCLGQGEAGSADINVYLQPSAFRRPSSLLPVCRLQKAFVSKMSLCKSRACIKAMLV